MLGVDAQDAGDPRKRTGHIQLVTGPRNMAVAEIFQIVVNASSHGHSVAACSVYLIVPGGPELTHIQAVVGKAPVD